MYISFYYLSWDSCTFSLSICILCSFWKTRLLSPETKSSSSYISSVVFFWKLRVRPRRASVSVWKPHHMKPRCPLRACPAEPSPPPCRGDGLLLALSPLILPFTPTFLSHPSGAPLPPVDLPFLATAKCVFHFVSVVEDYRCSLVALNLKLVSVFVFFVILYNSRRK